jgi:predicted transcriptional regulator
MTRCYPKLRGRLAELNMTYVELAREIGRSYAYVADIMRGAVQPGLWDCYTILAAVGLPDAIVNDYFPRPIKSA